MDDRHKPLWSSVRILRGLSMREMGTLAVHHEEQACANVARHELSMTSSCVEATTRCRVSTGPVAPYVRQNKVESIVTIT
jgi:hypothetical protein